MLLVFTCAMSHPSNAQTREPGKPKEFIYVLRLVPRLYDDKNWTKEDNAVLGRHFVRFQEAIKTGQLILAGRTSEPGDKTFGIAIFQAKDEAAARKFMEEDPAVTRRANDGRAAPVQRCARASESLIRRSEGGSTRSAGEAARRDAAAAFGFSSAVS